MATLITQHPIALDDQKYIIPDNAMVGDNVGKVNYLWSHPYFANRRWAIALDASSYTFSIVSGNGDGTFSIDQATGELTIANAGNLTGDKSIVVRVKVFDWYYHDTTCTVLVIPAADAVFFDSAYAGGDSDGTRAKPFLKLNNYGVSTGTAGKTYFYKRGETYSNDRNEFNNPKVAGEYPEYINMGAWGQGVRPKIDMTGSAGHFLDVGTIPWGNAAIVAADVCNNFRVFDFETVNDTPEDRGHFLVRPAGDNIEFHRIKCSNTSYQDGLIYLPTSDPIQGNEAVRNIYFADIELAQCQNRGFKIESEGVTVRNCYGINDNTLTDTELPAPQAAHRPGVDIKYVVCIVANVSSNNLGLAIRAGKQTYEWIYVDGGAFVFPVYVHAANDGIGGDYDITGTSWIKNAIVKNSAQVVYFGRQAGTTDISDGVIFDSVYIDDNCAIGVQVGESAINTVIRNVDASKAGGSNITILSAAGTGTLIENCTAMNTGGGTRGLRLDAAGISVYNTQYSGLQGTITGSNNTTSTAAVDLLGQGAARGLTVDIQGSPRPTNPSIGAYELAELQYTITATGSNGSVTGQGVINDGDDATLTAVPDAGYVFKRWEEDSVEVSTANPYVFEADGDRELTAVFAPVYTVSVETGSPGTATVSASPVESGEEVTVTATPNAGYIFGRWNEGGSEVSTANPYVFTVTEDRDLVAVWFVVYTNTITVSPSGYGTAEESPESPHQFSDFITLTATPAAGKRFVRWSVDGDTFSTNNPHSYFQSFFGYDLVAEFEDIPTYDLTVLIEPIGFGTVEESTTGPYKDGDDITLLATPAAGKRFVQWEFGTEGFWITSNPLLETGMGDFDLTLKAVFEDIPTYSVLLSASPTGEGLVSEVSSGPYVAGASVEVQATPGVGKVFLRWEVGGSSVSTAANYTFTMPASNQSLVAVFEDVTTYSVSLSVSPSGAGSATEVSSGPYVAGASVEVQATAGEGYMFLRWEVGGSSVSTDANYTFTMPASNQSLVAVFEEVVSGFFSLSLISSPGLAGSVSGSGEYEQGDIVNLSMTNNVGWTFLYWMQDGEVIGTEKNLAYTMHGADAVVYAFSELTGSMANARVEPEPEQIPEPLPQPEPQQEPEPEPEVLRGTYKLNNIDLAAQFGFIPRQVGKTNLAVSGCWDMPERLGKSFYDWEDQDGIEPYVAGPELRWSGRDVLLTGLLHGTDQADGLSKLYDLYAHLSALDSVALLECELGSWNVMVNGEVKAEHINEGWYTVDIPFRQPVVYMNAAVTEAEDLGNDLGIDSRSFKDLGFIFLSLEQGYNRPAPKGLTITSFPYESERVNKIGPGEIKMEGVFLSADYSVFKSRLNGLYSLLSQPGLRSIIVDGQVLHRVFVKNGVQVKDVRITGDGQVTAVLTINFTEGEQSVINWDYLTDVDGNILLNESGDKLMIIPDDTAVVMDQFVADGFGQLILTKEGEKIVIKK